MKTIKITWMEAGDNLRIARSGSVILATIWRSVVLREWSACIHLNGVAVEQSFYATAENAQAAVKMEIYRWLKSMDWEG